MSMVFLLTLAISEANGEIWEEHDVEGRGYGRSMRRYGRSMKRYGRSMRRYGRSIKRYGRSMRTEIWEEHEDQDMGGARGNNGRSMRA